MHSKFFNRSILIVFLFSLALGSEAQLLDQHSRDTARVYRSIERAMKNPDQVYALSLKKKK